MENYKILKTGCYLDFGCCDELLPYITCDPDCLLFVQRPCKFWINKGTVIKHHVNDAYEKISSIIKDSYDECVKNGIVSNK